MKLTKKKLIFIGYISFLVFIFLGIFWLILGSAKSLRIKQNNSAFINLGFKSFNKKFSNILVQKLSNYQKDYQGKKNLNSFNIQSEKINPQTNLTNYMAKLMFNSSSFNQNGQLDVNTYKKVIPKINQENIFQKAPFKASDFKTAPTNKTSIKRVASLIFSSFSYVNLNSTSTQKAFQDFDSNQDTSKLIIKANNLDKAINYLKTFSIPQKYKPLMAEYLNLIFQEKNYFLALANYKKDPLKAYLALSALNILGKKLALFIVKIDKKFRFEDKIYQF